MTDLFNGYVESQSTLRIMAGKELQLAPAPDGQSMQIRLPVVPEPTPALAPDQIPLGDATGKAMAEPAAPDQSHAAAILHGIYNDFYRIQQGVVPTGLASTVGELLGAQANQPTVGDERMQNIVGEFGDTNNAFQLLRQINPNAYIHIDEATGQPIAMIAHDSMMFKNLYEHPAAQVAAKAIQSVASLFSQNAAGDPLAASAVQASKALASARLKARASHKSDQPGPLLGSQVLVSGDQTPTTNLPLGSSTALAKRPSSESSTGQVRSPGLEIGAIDKTSGKMIVQNSDNATELFAKARAALPGFRADLDKIAAEVPGISVYGARVKEEATFATKLERKEAGRSPATFGDYLGGRLFADSEKAIGDAFRHIEQLTRIVDFENFLSKPKTAGYRAIHLQVELDNGLTAELQLLPSTFKEILADSHAHYTKWRDLENQEMTQVQILEMQKERRAIEARYKAAYEAWTKK